MLDIIGVGDTNVDVMIRVPHIASHDEKVRGQLLGNFPGGIIGNFCCAAAAFGAKAGAVCKVGMDDYGELAKSDLRRAASISAIWSSILPVRPISAWSCWTTPAKRR